MPVTDTQTLVLAPLGVTYYLKVAAKHHGEPPVSINWNDPTIDAKEIAEKIMQITERKLQPIAATFTDAHRDFAAVHEAAYQAMREAERPLSGSAR
jgi:hypothetical protein